MIDKDLQQKYIKEKEPWRQTHNNSIYLIKYIPQTHMTYHGTL